MLPIEPSNVFGSMVYEESAYPPQHASSAHAPHLPLSPIGDFDLLEAFLHMNSSDTSPFNASTVATETPYTPYERRPETYIVPILFAAIFIVGVLGNGTLIIVFLRHRAMRNVPNT